MPSHWEGPLLGSHTAGGGLFENQAVGALSGRVGMLFRDNFRESRFTTYYTQTNIVAGTASVTFNQGRSVLRLSHNVANQGPSVRLAGSTLVDGSITPVTTVAPAPTGNNTLSASFECVLFPTTIDTVTPSNFFVGFANGGAVHPLTTGGVLDVAGGMVDGVGFLWTGSNTPTLTLADNDAIRTLPNLPTLAAWAVNTPRAYGVRIDLTPAPQHHVSFYLNGRRIYRTRPGATQTGNFSANSMTWFCGLVTEGATLVGVNITSLTIATQDLDLA